MNKSLILIASGVILAIVIMFGVQKCNNSKIAKLEADRTLMLDSAKNQLKLALFYSEKSHSDSLMTDSLLKENIALKQERITGDKKIHQLQQNVYDLSIQNAANYANNKMKDTSAFKIDSNGIVKSDTNAIRFTDSVLVQNDLLEFDNQNLTLQVNNDSTIIKSQQTNLDDCNKENTHLAAAITLLLKANQDSDKIIKTLNHKISIKNFFGVVKDVAIGVGVVAVLIITKTIK